jgi:hypothetical protein
MNNQHEASITDEVSRVDMKRPHVVILGAGASRQAFPFGECNKRRLPLMSDFNEVLGLKELLAKWRIDYEKNFEDIYNDLVESNRIQEIDEINRLIKLHFGEMCLPDTPTLYDHLILSLRGKDLIATFNWDPLLVHAFERNRRSGLILPRMVFLHGNIAVGYCNKCGRKGSRLGWCDKCESNFIPTELLYPIRQKNYSKNTFIANEWMIFKRDLRTAFMVTIFGYSGPKSDTEAITAMQEAWGDKNIRNMEQVAFITTQSEPEINTNWDSFIHTHHYEIDASFYNSWIANHPRRTGEAYLNQYIDAKFIDNNPIPTNLDFPQLWQWYGQFKGPEEKSPDF